MSSNEPAPLPEQLRCERGLAGLRLLRMSSVAQDARCVLAVHEGQVRDYRKEAYADFHTLTFHLDGAPLRCRVAQRADAAHSVPGRVSLQRCDERNRWDSDAPSRWAQFYLPVELVKECATAHFGVDADSVTLQTVTGLRDTALVRRLYQAVAALQADAAAAWCRMNVWAWEIAVYWLGTYSTLACAAQLDAREHLPAYKLRLAHDYIEAHLDQPVRVAAIAGELGVSAAHFARAFRNETGEPPHRYLLRRRAERARALLSNGRQTLADIAIESGFANQAHLTSVFSQLFGITPGTYRRQIAAPAWHRTQPSSDLHAH